MVHFLPGKQMRLKRQENTNVMSYHCFFIIISLWVDTHNHPDFSFSIKVVFKQMCHFRVPVWHHLEEDKGSVKLHILENNHWQILWTWVIILLCIDIKYFFFFFKLMIQWCADKKMSTLLVPHIWFSRRTSIHVRSVIKDWLILPVKKMQMRHD